MEHTSNNNISIGWLKFLIFWKIPIGLFLSVINLIKLIKVIQYSSITVIFTSIYILISLVFPIIVFAYSSKYKKRGYYLLKALLIIEVLYNSAISAINAIDPFSSNALRVFLYVFIPTLTILSIIWIYPNFIYLRKRKQLFNSTKSNKPNKTESALIQKENNRNVQKSKNLGKHKLKKNKNISLLKTNRKTFVVIFILILVIIFSIGSYFLVNHIKSLKNTMKYYKQEYINTKRELAECQTNQIKLKEKANFLDENIVFVLSGYGNYYYTYDQAQQVTNGNSSYYWIYDKETAINNGYKPFFKAESAWEKYKRENK